MILNLGSKLKQKMGWNEANVYEGLLGKCIRYNFSQGKIRVLVEMASFFSTVAIELAIDIILGLLSL